MKKKILRGIAIVGIVLAVVACQAKTEGDAGGTSSAAQKEKKAKSEKKTQKTDSSSQSESSSSKASASSDKTTESKETVELYKVTDGLPQDAQSANTDKIYATGHAKVYYRSIESGGFSAQTPDFKGYTEAKVREILGTPEAVITDPKYIQDTFKNQELENLKALFQSQYLTEEQARAFYAGAADIAQAAGLQQDYHLESDFILYSYNQNQIYLVFDKGELYYITPHPDYLYFK